MGEFKHLKYKNTGIIFELLTRQVVSDVLSDKRGSSLSILKKYFKKGSEIAKELSLYKSITEFNKKEKTIASKLLDIVLEQRRAIDQKALKKEKYKLLGEIKSAFNEQEFFNGRIANYKLYASIYKLFENYTADNPTDYINTYEVILESITSDKSKQPLVSETVKIWDAQSDEVKQLAFQIIIEKFNSKYKSLNIKQKTLIGKIINENTDTKTFKDYILSECELIKSNLTKLVKKVSNPTLQIKLKETINLLGEITTAKFIRDEHYEALMSYYELIETLKKP